MTGAVHKCPANPDRATPFGPASIEHRTVDSSLRNLGTYVMTFHEDGRSEPWTLRYEETAYVASGEVRITDLSGPEETETVGSPGDVLVLPEGCTVMYGATAGTVLILSITPVNWRELAGE